jgi:predicted metal-dependent hydrolase
VNISIRPFAGVRVAVPYAVSFEKAEEFVYAKTAWIQRHLARMRQHEREEKHIAGASIDLDRAKARRQLITRLNQLAEKHGFTYNRVYIRNQRTRWGSCSHHNNISLNIRMLRLPEELVDYVILHELVHTRVKNHSRSFWAELDKLVGNGKRMASRLRNYGIGVL